MSVIINKALNFKNWCILYKRINYSCRKILRENAEYRLLYSLHFHLIVSSRLIKRFNAYLLRFKMNRSWILISNHAVSKNATQFYLSRDLLCYQDRLLTRSGSTRSWPSIDWVHCSSQFVAVQWSFTVLLLWFVSKSSYSFDHIFKKILRIWKQRIISIQMIFLHTISLQSMKHLFLLIRRCRNRKLRTGISI